MTSRRRVVSTFPTMSTDGLHGLWRQGMAMEVKPGRCRMSRVAKDDDDPSLCLARFDIAWTDALFSQGGERQAVVWVPLRMMNESAARHIIRTKCGAIGTPPLAWPCVFRGVDTPPWSGQLWFASIDRRDSEGLLAKGEVRIEDAPPPSSPPDHHIVRCGPRSNRIILALSPTDVSSVMRRILQETRTARPLKRALTVHHRVDMRAGSLVKVHHLRRPRQCVWVMVTSVQASELEFEAVGRIVGVEKEGEEEEDVIGATVSIDTPFSLMCFERRGGGCVVEIPSNLVEWSAEVEDDPFLLVLDGTLRRGWEGAGFVKDVVSAENASHILPAAVKLRFKVWAATRGEVVMNF